MPCFITTLELSKRDINKTISIYAYFFKDIAP